MTLAAAMVWAIPSLGSAQGQEGQILLKVVPDPHFIGRPARAYEMYGPLDVLNVEITVTNTTTVEGLRIRDGFFEALAWELVPQGAKLAFTISLVTVEISGWTCTPSDSPCNADSPELLEPGRSVRASLVLRPATESIILGEYRLHLDATGARNRLVDSDLAPWNGRMLDKGSIPLVVHEIRTNADRAKFFEVQAVSAIRRRDYESALAAFRRMRETEPGNANARLQVGVMLMQLGRFEEAVRELETLWRAKKMKGAGDYLSVAYIALGREKEAEVIVRQLVGPQYVATVMGQARDRAQVLSSRTRQ